MSATHVRPAAAKGHALPREATWQTHPALPHTVGLAREAASDYARRQEACASAIKAIALAVSEAVTNVVLHAYRDREPGQVWLELSRPCPDAIEVVVADEGSGMAPRSDSPGLGLGLPLIGRLSDAVGLRAAVNGGTVLTMRFSVAEDHADNQPE